MAWMRTDPTFSLSEDNKNSIITEQNKENKYATGNPHRKKIKETNMLRVNRNLMGYKGFATLFIKMVKLFIMASYKYKYDETIRLYHITTSLW